METCSHHYFFSGNISDSQKCLRAMSPSCQDQQQFINFYQLTYCSMDGIVILFIPMSIILLFLIFKIVLKIVSDYLAPSIEYITDWLQLSEPLAAVTLLAVANGAGDVVTALAASANPEGLSYNIGALYGAAFFVATLVVGFTLLTQKEGLQLSQRGLVRDIGFYLAASILILSYSCISEFGLLSSALMLGLYGLFVLVVYVQEKKPSTIFVEDSAEIEKQNTQQFIEMSVDQIDTTTDTIDNVIFKGDQNISIEPQTQVAINSSYSKCCCIISGIISLVDKSIGNILRLMVPPATESNFLPVLCYLTILPGLIITSLILFGQKYWILYGVFPLGLILTLLSRRSLNKNSSYPPNNYLTIQIFITVESLILTYLMCGILIDLLTFVGMLSNLSTSYLGITIIAMGNALPEAIVTITLAKQGYALMGLTGAYAGQLFGLLIGLGLGLIRTNLEFGPVGLNLLKLDHIGEHLIMLIIILGTATIMIITLIYGFINGFIFRKHMAYTLISFYGVVYCIVSAVAFYQAYRY